MRNEEAISNLSSSNVQSPTTPNQYKLLRNEETANWAQVYSDLLHQTIIT